jgi:hypothetical protein
MTLSIVIMMLQKFLDVVQEVFYDPSNHLCTQSILCSEGVLWHIEPVLLLRHHSDCFEACTKVAANSSKIKQLYNVGKS